MRRSKGRLMQLARRTSLLLALVSVAFLCCRLVHSHEVCDPSDSECSHDGSAPDPSVKYTHPMQMVHLSVVACGDRQEETLIMIKSAVILSSAHVFVHIFADDELQPIFKEQLKSWPSDIRRRFTFKIYPISFPEAGYKPDEWRKLFKPCASQRLFFPDILKDVDAVLYVDTDILFLRPIEDVWQHFSNFNASHIAACSPEHESPNAGWYNRFARHPYYGHLGINSGVMLMNLTRMREVRWLDHIIPYYKEYKLKITWGDQDLINIFFHFFPDKLYVYACDWNYRPDHCMYMSNCKAAEKSGVSVLHGSRSVYHNEKQPVFKAVYEAFRDYKFGDALSVHLVQAMKEGMAAHSSMPCGKVAELFTKQLQLHVK